MTQQELNKYIKVYETLFDFLGLDYNKDAIIKKERKRTDITKAEQNQNIKDTIKNEIKKRIKKRFKDNPNQLFNDIIELKIKNDNYDEYTKARILDLTFSAIDSIKKPNNTFYINFIKKNPQVKSLLNNLFIEETDDNEVEKELLEKYKHLESLIKVYKKDFFTKENARSGLTLKEVKDLIDRYRNEGDIEAKRILIEKNIGLCRKEAGKKYLRESALSGYEDLCQDAVEGLLKAIEKYNYKKGVRFSTFALFWIRQSVIRSVDNNSRIIRLPVHMNTWVKQTKDDIRKLEAKEGTQTPYQIMEKLNLSEEEYNTFVAAVMPPRNLDSKLRVGDDDDLSLGDAIPSKEDTEEDVLSNIENQELREMLRNCLTPRELDVLLRSFGVGTDKESLESIGKTYHVSRSCIRQNQRTALVKLTRYAKELEKEEKGKDKDFVLRKY